MEDDYIFLFQSKYPIPTHLKNLHKKCAKKRNLLQVTEIPCFIVESISMGFIKEFPFWYFQTYKLFCSPFWS